jgi:hypothetical protein
LEISAVITAPFASLFHHGEGSNVLQLLYLTRPHPNLLPGGEGIKILYLKFLRAPLSHNKLKLNFEIGFRNMGVSPIQFSTELRAQDYTLESIPCRGTYGLIIPSTQPSVAKDLLKDIETIGLLTHGMDIREQR